MTEARDRFNRVVNEIIREFRGLKDCGIAEFNIAAYWVIADAIIMNQGNDDGKAREIIAKMMLPIVKQRLEAPAIGILSKLPEVGAFEKRFGRGAYMAAVLRDRGTPSSSR